LSDRPRTEGQRLDWLRLIRSENVGARTFHDLVSHYGGVRPALTALPNLARRGGSARPLRICSRAEAEAELKAAQAAGVEFFTLGEPEYPSRLQMIDAISGRASASSLPRTNCRLAECFRGRR
jgi:DNA processing protein